jgi:hypothetical protein
VTVVTVNERGNSAADIHIVCSGFCS